ncbi:MULTISPECIES: HAD family hydrolase [unclassified Burkholderia]|uniref:HAD-IIIC family phosphatase n=1 Tax=unclassified Burkholderia TaxID=2613784 RepID=UPI000F57BE0B|nr:MULTISPECIES: HAD-IIIC family phosphatase [unclassified Burkholderia]RQS01723.1 HAD-IIIC family phosphatase [Burkholderia sp. Bp8994]RQR46968.1 HAD-IIIC family phosphatase [Burkholderia sp. Bp9131]RQR79854.1 HAD-IIIC family phosphatase [Burkholderia sp. Bp9015]RQS35026.1 HAD-IIIC family phosphatase [Burkholderia sp. Bp8995]RQS45352.1 HAD-IIIC family phosphatase [Burkholderia sp. Bp8990]
MKDDLYTALAWLPRPPDDFSARCRTLVESIDDDPGAGLGRRLRQLANCALGENQLIKLGRAIVALQGAGRTLAPLTPFRLGLVGNGTLDHLVLPLVASAARHGVALEIVSGHYGQVMQEALAPDSTINRAQVDAVLVALDYRGLPLNAQPGDEEAAQHSVAAALDQIDALRAGFRQHGNAPSIVQTLAPPSDTLFGNRDALIAGTPLNLVERFNRALAQRVAESNDILFDVAHVAGTVGLANWHSPAQWNLAKYPFAGDYVPLYADHVGRLLGAARGKSRRVLVLDLDNTLWGGVIGDDLLEGIKVAQGDAVGEAHLAVQQLALSLRARGIVLAVSSKNNDDTARLPFQKHPEMLLREQHFAVFQANWNDKATNIRAIADELSLGIDSMVFLDDNPVERNLVRTTLPEVAVPELPDDPSLYARTLAAAGYFESLAFLPEDQKRADMYQDNARRVALRSQAGDMDAYLRSLDMKIDFAPFDDTGRARIVQLINKSNQFNLTTRRYTDAEIHALEGDGRVFTLQVRLTDTFGDNGMISVVICRPDERAPSTWQIDSWLMSCRVLGRQVEQMVLREVLQHARQRDVTRVIGRYIPTDRNALVKDHYAKLGFEAVSEEPDGTTVWEMASDREIAPGHFAVTRAGFDTIAAA